ncbi:MAG: nucleotidyltransferase domain-containing protein [Armatimonadetes bacterium]|nr:nucleotidyltransferase domain-containing protein [Armatimonadota bacterium]
MGQIFPPLVVLSSHAPEELKALAPASLSRRHCHHDADFARAGWRDYQRPGAGKTVKRPLYLRRVLITGVVLLTEGAVEADLHRLNGRFGLNLEPLTAAKAREQAAVTRDIQPHLDALAGLFERLDAARGASPLPEDVPSRAAPSDF